MAVQRQRLRLIIKTPHQVSRLTSSRICLKAPPTPLDWAFHRPACLAPCVTPSVQTSPRWGRNVYRLSIGFALRLHLRSRLTLGGFPSPGTLGLPVSKSFTCFNATHAGILTSCQSTAPHDATSAQQERSPTIRKDLAFRIRGFGCELSPLHFRRRSARPVSYYALFQGWLLLSQPPGCLSSSTSLPHLARIGDLSRRSGLFPFRPRSFSPTVSLPCF